MSNHMKLAYDSIVRAKNHLLAENQEQHFHAPLHVVSAVLTDCDGYVTESGIAVLEIGEVLPHNKDLASAVLHDHWLGCVQAAIGKLVEKSEVPHFDMAMVGFRIAMPRGANTTRIWDASNRAFNLIINNLKGVLFSDDDIEHLAFAVVGCWAEEPGTAVFVGDYRTQKEEVLRLMDCRRTAALSSGK